MPGLPAQEQLEGRVGGLVLVAAVLALLDPLDGPLGRVRVEVDARALGAALHRAPAGELRDQDVAAVADEPGLDVLERPGVGLNAGRVHPALVGEGVAADVRPVRVGLQVAELVDEMGGLGEPPQTVVRDALVAHLELERGKDRDEVRVAGALAVAVHRALDQPGPGVHGGERVGDAALGVVVGVDPDLHPVPQRIDHRGGRLRDLGRQARAVRVAEGDVLGAGRHGGAQALERVPGVVAPARRRSARRRRRPACRCPRRKQTESAIIAEVLVARDLGDLLEVEAPRLADQGADRREARPPARASAASSSAATPRRRVMPKAQTSAGSSSTFASSSKSSASFGFEPGSRPR